MLSLTYRKNKSKILGDFAMGKLAGDILGMFFPSVLELTTVPLNTPLVFMLSSVSDVTDLNL